MADMIKKVEKSGYSLNEKGFVVFESRKWDYKGDKGTFVKVAENEITIKVAAKGIISNGYENDLKEFCKIFEINFNDLSCGSTTKVK